MSGSTSTLPLLSGASKTTRTNGVVNGVNGNSVNATMSEGDIQAYVKDFNQALAKDESKTTSSTFHGDLSYGEPKVSSIKQGKLANASGVLKAVVKNPVAFWKVLTSKFTGHLDGESAAKFIAGFDKDHALRKEKLDERVAGYWQKMLHPPPTFLGDAFQYRQVDGRFNSVLYPHLGQAGAPYAKTVPAKSRLLGAQPDPGDIFDRLLARDETRTSKSGLSSMLIYHATIIIHDIFRTNSSDRNISDTSSYLDLSPLYGFNEEMCNSVRDLEQGLGLLKPDVFAEDRLLRQPPGVCIMLVMYNRYHNYVATQLRRINENGRFEVPKEYREHIEVARELKRKSLLAMPPPDDGEPSLDMDAEIQKFEEAYAAAWKKLDDDLFGTARLITCGLYINISIHDYLRALMGFHQWDTTFTLDPRTSMASGGDKVGIPEGCGNQVSVEFNLLYRFHCAISANDEKWTEDAIKSQFMRKAQAEKLAKDAKKNKSKIDAKGGGAAEQPGATMGPIDAEMFDPKMLTVKQFNQALRAANSGDPKGPRHKADSATFGGFKRDPITNMFDDKVMIETLVEKMNDPIGEFGPRNVPRVLKPVEIMGILQARKWEIGTLNDFREFFGMKRHETFETVTPNVEIQNALRDLYDHPDKIELYPGVFCEGDKNMKMDPGPARMESTLWSAIFSDAITLVRSDRFYTTDWNTNTLTAWGMKEVSPDENVLKTSVFHRLIQRAFPGWMPYNSMYYFHPFYTYEKNKEYAEAQGYAPLIYKYKEVEPNEALMNQQTSKPWSSHVPNEPKVPVVVKDYNEADKILREHPHRLVEPAALDAEVVPEDVKTVMDRRIYAQTNKNYTPPTSLLKEEDLKQLIYEYYETTARKIVNREKVIVMKGSDAKDGKPAVSPVYQIDVTRDLAIPVVTLLVANLLGIENQIKTENNSSGKYSENELYQHITNCQMFLAYNADETKLWKRRMAFKTSMEFLFDLTKKSVSGNSPGLLSRIWSPQPYKDDKNQPVEQRMKAYSVAVARMLLKKEDKEELAAAALLLTALDAGYNSIMTFTCVLDYFLDDSKYEEGASGEGPAQEKELTDKGKKQKQGGLKYWAELQDLALSKVDQSDRIKEYVLEAQRMKVRLPLIRKVREPDDGDKLEILEKNKVRGQRREVPPGSMVLWRDTPRETVVEPGDMVIIDIHGACNDEKEDDLKNAKDFNPDRHTKYHLTYHHGLSEGSFGHEAKLISLWGITAMIKVLAQMKRLRPAPGTQGVLKRINIEQRYNYCNYMSKAKVKKIRDSWKKELEKSDLDPEVRAKISKKKEIYERTLVKSRTYLTPDWSEMVPFPSTWRIRFDGYGKGMQDPTERPRRREDQDADSLNQPRGPSHVGGTFAEISLPPCPCADPRVECVCKKKANGLAKDMTKGKEIAGLISA